MYCKKCGSEIAYGSKFCPRCGAVAEGNNMNAAYYNGAQTYNQPMSPVTPPDSYASRLQGEILTNGIMGLAFGSSFFLSFLGIIFSSIAKNKSNAYINLRGQLEGRAKVGSILGKVGLILSIVLTAISALYFTILFFAILEEM